MTREKSLQPALPTLTSGTMEHAHLKKVKKKNSLAKSANGQRLLRSTASSRARVRSVSPKSGPWVPAPGKATRGGRLPWQKLEVAHVRNGDLSTDDEERLRGEAQKYEKKIHNLINEVGTLRNEVVLQKALQEIEHKEDLLNTSSHILQQQEEQLENVQEELQQVEAELVVSEKENKLLRKNMVLIAEDAEITKTQKEQLNYERERLMKKLIEAELDGQAAAHQVRELKDFVRWLQGEQDISSADHARFVKQKEAFLKTLSDFESTNRALQHLLRDQHRLESSGLRMTEQQDILLRKLTDCDMMNERMRNQLLDCETLIADLKDQLQVEKEERLVLNNLQGSLENTRGHLQKQLRIKESDCNRMSVQIRSLETQLLHEKVEKDHLQEVVNSFKSKTDRDKEALKKATRAQKSRAEKLEEELMIVRKQLANLECQDCEHVTHLSSVNSHVETLSRQKHQLSLECDQLRMRVAGLEKELNRMEESSKSVSEALTAQLQEKKAESSAMRLQYERLKASRIRGEADEAILRFEEQAREKERLQQDGEFELEKVKQCLHQRLQELEPLPELLRATELRLQEANEKISTLEKKNVENTKLIAELTSKLDFNNETLDQYRHRCNDSQDSNKSLQSKSDSLERRLRELEEKNAELMASQSKLQEAVRLESISLEEKTRENASLTRQLEGALTDGRKHNDQSRDRYLSKERMYQSRIVDLESQLNQLRVDQTKLKREKDETERKFNSRLYDLKDRLEQCQSSNRSMQNYVQFLKNSYSNVFGDAPSAITSMPSPIRPSHT